MWKHESQKVAGKVLLGIPHDMEMGGYPIPHINQSNILFMGFLLNCMNSGVPINILNGCYMYVSPKSRIGGGPKCPRQNKWFYSIWFCLTDNTNILDYMYDSLFNWQNLKFNDFQGREKLRLKDFQ
jgi:hypothetical protein